MRALVLAAPVLLASLLVGCGAEPTTPAAPTPDAGFELPKIDFEAVAHERQVREASQAQLQAGLQCGWHGAWMKAVREARRTRPSEFRAAAVGRAFAWGGVTFVVGVGGTLVLAWVLPRTRRRVKAAPREDGAATTGLAPSVPPWVEYFKGLGKRALARMGRLLRVEQFDPLLMSEHMRAIESCRDAERQLAVVQAGFDKLRAPSPGPVATAAAPDPRPLAVSAGVDAWRAELMGLRRRLEAPGQLPPELAPDRLAPRLATIVRAARDLRIATERAVIAGATGESLWVTAERELGDRPETPRDHVASARAELAPWVRTLGLAGVGAMIVALPMLACWMAAGAFPLFFAMLFSLGGLGAIAVARVHLHRAGPLPLLPGFADRVVSWLTTVLALTLLGTMISSWMSTESGLDLGDPPPVAMPEPKMLEAPKLFEGVAPTPTPTPVPTPAPTPTTAPAPTPE